ncbi:MULTISPECIES: ABC transporter ATP-binding protein [Lonsdalea]|uniref:Sulfonate ABC transporter ATP-binding protein n=2 Tax=Lonsdalea TaxID=1082702 RepID=A0ACD1JGN8_9GAMM|nr:MULTISPECIES: ABC transporter ATP-binding protein [Lonsdalea]OSN00806.1 sulfonate ABC transporter ATP-binding protein [Lonsdalea populi]QPQ24274.1 ABC transporter ATP-binding protein [Lonsdalea populi]RAT16453.1 sulfonate ABC transporter ATP-binding protein [Lonsdalea quercina]RAT23242.1 sulfonate ABC transporter ATP-binding protein [Lonsdalea populi]RAT26819.1 sulfonate ABC transporter ATP-binding protein [Lonsdalea populi]
MSQFMSAEEPSVLTLKTATARPAVVVRDANIIYPSADQSVHALKDINLTIRQGEFVSFIGPSGCGKTTLLRAIADLEPLTSGEVKVNDMTPSEARQAGAYGYVFQSPVLLPWRTVLANVMLPLQIQGRPPVQSEAIAREQLARVGLAGFEKTFPWQLSGGMQQRVSIARALGFSPQILMMDEPFGALDELTRDNLNQQLQQLWYAEQRTMVFVTHSIAEAVYLSTRIVIMSPRPGRIVDVLTSPLPPERDLSLRDTPEFIRLAQEVREALVEGHHEH